MAITFAIAGLIGLAFFAWGLFLNWAIQSSPPDDGPVSRERERKPNG